jgi:hypothetical protein
MSEYFVQDPSTEPRAPDIPAVPLLRSLEDIRTHFAPITVDCRQGWDAVPVGERCWKLVGFNVTVGINEIMPIVRDQQGKYQPNQWVNWHYPDIPPQRDLKPPYFAKGLAAQTKGPPDNNGAHFTVTGHHNVGPGNAGPDSVWVAAEPGGPQFSDAVHGLGMRVNTNHLIVSPIFQDVIKTSDQPHEPNGNDQPGEEPEEPDTSPDSDHYLSIVVDGQELGRIPFSQTGSG